ncbi:MAG: hypothetical protein HKN89_09970 [Eudoraea sp.]|nr:hypothetical protein [Eudoraea sp.]
MKINLILLPIILLILLVGSPDLSAQDSIALPTTKELKVRERTVLAQFESTMVLTADERLRMKIDRRDLILKRRAIIDTLDISDRRRRRLLKELYNSPTSDRWERVVANLGFEDDPDQE